MIVTTRQVPNKMKRIMVIRYFSNTRNENNHDNERKVQQINSNIAIIDR